MISGVLVQAMVQDGRELIVGMTRDPVFGPMVMFGLGGILVEVLRDVAFRIAPFGREEARRMMAEIRGARLLGRGARLAGRGPGRGRGRPAPGSPAGDATIPRSPSWT